MLQYDILVLTNREIVVNQSIRFTLPVQHGNQRDDIYLFLFNSLVLQAL